MSTPEPITGAEYLARSLAANGTTHVFFIDAVLRRTLIELDGLGVKRVLGHSEKGVAYMADGYARIAGRPGAPAMTGPIGGEDAKARFAEPRRQRHIKVRGIAGGAVDHQHRAALRSTGRRVEDMDGIAADVDARAACRVERLDPPRFDGGECP